MYFDIEDLLGTKQAGAFEKDLVTLFKTSQFPSSDSLDAVKTLLTKDPLNSLQIPPWKEDHLKTLLEELYRLGKNYFGNTSFAEGLDEVLEDMPDEDREFFISWLDQSPAGKLWAIG